MAITEEMKEKVVSLNGIKASAETAIKTYRTGLKELYKQFLKENGLDGYICHKANIGTGEQARAVLYVKEWEGDFTNIWNVEIRYKLANDVRDMDRDYPACCRYTTSPLDIMNEILQNYVPYERSC